MSGVRGVSMQQVRREVEQLRRERNVRRVHVSQTLAELVGFVQQTQREDLLVNGFSSEKGNPFRSKSSLGCALF